MMGCGSVNSTVFGPLPPIVSPAAAGLGGPLAALSESSKASGQRTKTQKAQNCARHTPLIAKQSCIPSPQAPTSTLEAKKQTNLSED
jgi:hypothetical protein